MIVQDATRTRGNTIDQRRAAGSIATEMGLD